MKQYKFLVIALIITGCTFINASQLAANLSKAEFSTLVDADVGHKKNTTTSTTTEAPTSAPETTPSSTDEPTNAPETTPVITTSQPITSSSSTTPTSSTSTTPKSSTSTTSKPTTSSSSTTPKSTSSTSTTPQSTTSSTSTTPQSTTSTTPQPAPPKPTPYPEPSIGHWNSSCIMMKMAAKLNVTYETKDNKAATALLNLPASATVDDSMCGNVTQTIQLNWGPAEAQHSMLLQFDLKNQSSVLTMLRFIIPIVGDNFPDAAENQTIQLLHMGKVLSAPSKMSYHCTRSQRFNLTETVPDKQAIGWVSMHDVQVEAFRKPSDGNNFSQVYDCDSTSTTDIVPIAVGIALAAMIMIILTAYLCARRRSTSRGYMSF